MKLLELWSESKSLSPNIIEYADSYKHSYLENLGLGAILEIFVSDTLSKLGFNLNPHLTQNRGLDIIGFLGDKTVAGECLNWKCGGYIHPKRWDRIIRNLVESKADYKMLFAFGVNLTKAQHEEAEKLNIHIIHRKFIDVFDEDKVSIINWCRRVIYSILFNVKQIPSKVINVFSRVKLFACASSSHIINNKLHKILNIIDKRNDRREKNMNGFKCYKCGSSDNLEAKSTKYCDSCLIKLIIETLVENEILSPITQKQIKKGEDYAT